MREVRITEVPLYLHTRLALAGYMKFKFHGEYVQCRVFCSDAL